MRETIGETSVGDEGSGSVSGHRSGSDDDDDETETEAAEVDSRVGDPRLGCHWYSAL